MPDGVSTGTATEQQLLHRLRVKQDLVTSQKIKLMNMLSIFVAYTTYSVAPLDNRKCSGFLSEAKNW